MTIIRNHPWMVFFLLPGVNGWRSFATSGKGNDSKQVPRNGVVKLFASFLTGDYLLQI